jgi:hypothetical protein
MIAVICLKALTRQHWKTFSINSPRPRRRALIRNDAEGLGSAGVLARRLRRPAEGIRAVRGFT